MTGGLAHLVYLQEHGVVVAVNPDLLDPLDIARRFALDPEFLARPTPVRGPARFQGFSPGILVHKGEHQDLAGFKILYNSWDQATAFFEIQGNHA